jgi:phospholipid transport system substrate-binding protein
MNAVLSGVLALLLLGAPLASPAAADDAQSIVRETTEKVLEALRSEGDTLKDDPKRLHAIIEQLILPHFDFRQMSQWVLGPHWRSASAEQRDAFVEQFEALLVRTYSSALVDYRNQRVNYLPARERSADEVTVRAIINQGGGPTIPIAYEMYRSDTGWKVYDVAIDGVSLVINYRSSFGHEIRRNGIDGLIQRLASKNLADNG